MEYRQQHDPIAAALRAAAEAAKIEQDAKNEAMWKEAQRKTAERAEVFEKWALARPEAEAALARLRQAVAPAQVRLTTSNRIASDLDVVTEPSGHGSVLKCVSLYLRSPDDWPMDHLATIGWSPSEGWSSGSKSSADLEGLLAQIMTNPRAYEAVVEAQKFRRPHVLTERDRHRKILGRVVPAVAIVSCAIMCTLCRIWVDTNYNSAVGAAWVFCLLLTAASLFVWHRLDE